MGDCQRPGAISQMEMPDEWQSNDDDLLQALRDTRGTSPGE